MKTKTSKQKITAYAVIYDDRKGDILYLTDRQKSGLKRSKNWKHIINLRPIAETTIITKIKIW